SASAIQNVTSPGSAAEDTLVADAPGDAVGVKALEQELGRTAPGPEQVAEARERDLAVRGALVDERGARLLVGGGAERFAVAQASPRSLRSSRSGSSRRGGSGSRTMPPPTVERARSTTRSPRAATTGRSSRSCA